MKGERLIFSENIEHFPQKSSYLFHILQQTPFPQAIERPSKNSNMFTVIRSLEHVDTAAGQIVVLENKKVITSGIVPPEQMQTLKILT